MQNAPEGPHEDSHESAHGKFTSAHGKFSSAHENVCENVLGQFSHVLFSHVFLVDVSDIFNFFSAQGR